VSSSYSSSSSSLVFGESLDVDAARHFVHSCLHHDPHMRPKMKDLLTHPFLKRFVDSIPRTLPPSQSSASRTKIHTLRLPRVDSPASMDMSEVSLGVPKKWHIFLSYAQKDSSGMATSLYFAFRRCGLRTWFDNFETDVTESGMKAGVRNSQVFVACLTTHYLTRPWCLREIAWARAAGKSIIFIRETDRRFAVWEYDHWTTGKMWIKDRSAFVKPDVKSKLAKFAYDRMGASNDKTLSAARSAVDHAANSLNILPFRRKSWAFDALVDEVLRRAGLRLPAIESLYLSGPPPRLQRRDSGSATSARRYPDRLCIVSTSDTVGTAISRSVTRALSEATGGVMACTVIRDGEMEKKGDDDDERRSTAQSLLLVSRDVPLLVVLSEGITKCHSFSRAVETAVDTERDLHFVYATRRPDSECEWEFNGREVRNASSLVQEMLGQFEAIPFRWPNSTARYEHDAMTREILRRIGRGG